MLSQILKLENITGYGSIDYKKGLHYFSKPVLQVISNYIQQI